MYLDNQYVDANLGGFFSSAISAVKSAVSNPVKAVQSAVSTVNNAVNKVTPAPLQKISPVNVLAAPVAKINALALRASQTAASTLYGAAAASPLGNKILTPALNLIASAPGGSVLLPQPAAQPAIVSTSIPDVMTERALAAQQQQQQAALDAQAQADYVARQSVWQSQQSQFATQPSAYSSQPDYSGDYSTQQIDAGQPVDTVTGQADVPLSPAPETQAKAAGPSWLDWWMAPIKPWGGVPTAKPSSADTQPPTSPDKVPAWDPYAPISSSDSTGYFINSPGANDMQLSNTQSSKLLPSETFRDSGMGDIWGDLMKTATTLYGQKTSASIQQSQAAQADATARIATANAAATAAQQRPALSTPAMLTAAAVLAGALFFMRKRRAR
jgi:hypothetical protein